MSIFKVLVYVKREVQKASLLGGTYTEEETAYAPMQYFSSLELAKAFVQRYSEHPLNWETSFSYMWSVELPELCATIFLEKDSYFDTTLMPPLPTKFAPRGDRD